ncbi:alpha/beta fold hydrolase [Nocardia vinacea]|uniref:alpha/beta fold hydrolase n=1 Tax=Nocardia vinacea TaxID=96468 RepID=UPI0002EE6D86|nr:alpha/beta hydrolase [Nocardia vinacea]
MSQATAQSASFTLRGGAGTLAAWESVPPPDVEMRGTVLLVPGFTGSKEDFEAMQPILSAAGFRCVAYDQRGQWQSDGPDEASGYTMADFADDLLLVADQISDDTPIHLVGHSFGGYVARAALAAHPDGFRSLTLLASGPSSTSDINFAPPQLVAQLIESGGQQALWEQMSQAVAALVPPAKLEFLRNRIFTTKKANLIGIMRAMEGPTECTAALRATGLPILIAYGNSGDLWPPSVHERYAEELGACTAVYDGVGHLPNEERPARVCADLITFWTGISPAR